MIDRFFEGRIENWARANRELPRVKKGATQAFCDSLKYIYGPPEKDGDESAEARVTRCSPAARTIDVRDANILDMAYRDPRMSGIMRGVLRLYYVKKISPRRAEQILYLAPKTFRSILEHTVLHFKAVVASYEKEQLLG